MSPQIPSEFKVAGLPLDILWQAMGHHAIVSIADSAGTILFANELFSEISGYANEELVGANHRIVKSARHPDSFYAQMWRTISRGTVWEGEVCNRHKSGSLYWVWSTIVPILDDGGLPTHYVSFRTDITNEKRQLEAMCRLEHNESELLRLAPFGIARLRERIIVRANDEFHRMLGYAPGELLGRSTRVIYHSDEHFAAIGEAAYGPLMRGEHVKYEDELRRRDGGSLHVIAGGCSLIKNAPMSDTLYVIQDISRHKQLEDELAKLAQKNAAISQAKSEFIAIVTHELKTPLHGILGAAQLMELTVAQDDDGLTKELQSSTQRLMRVVDEVIEYTSYDLREGDAEEAANLSTLLIVTAEKYDLRARQGGIEFATELSAALDAEFCVDAKCLAKIVSVLLDNAVKFTHQGHVRLEASLDESGGDRAMLDVLVADTGVGMTERIAANPFVPFQQDESPLNRRHEGLGLGLALARKLVDRLDGSITLSSETNRGTRVRVRLPIRRPVAGGVARRAPQ